MEVKLKHLFNFDYLNLNSAMAKEVGNDEDMVEMINSEIESLTNQLKELEEGLKVINSLVAG